MPEIQRILKLNISEQRHLLRTFSRLSLPQQLDILEIHHNIFHKLRQNEIKTTREKLSYSALIIAIQIFSNNTKRIQTLDFNTLSLDQIRTISKKRAKVFLYKQLRTQGKRDKLIAYWSIVKTLKDDEIYSFREISSYLKKYHKFDVAHSTIYNLWQQLEIKKDSKNG